MNLNAHGILYLYDVKFFDFPHKNNFSTLKFLRALYWKSVAVINVNSLVDY